MDRQERDAKLGGTRDCLAQSLGDIVVLVVQENLLARFDQVFDKILCSRGQLQGQTNLEKVYDAFKLLYHIPRFVNAGKIQRNNQPVVGINWVHGWSIAH